jgi:hypothetical protein
MHPVPTHVPRRATCPCPWPAHARVTSRVSSDTKCKPRPPRDRACYPWQLSRISRLSPQTNTSLSCALCPHSCAPRNNFPIGHPSSNRSRLSMLNPEFFSDELPENKVYLVDMSILSILLSPRPGCHTYSWQVGPTIATMRVHMLVTVSLFLSSFINANFTKN